MFTKTTVNRLWKWVMGTELIGPVANLELGDEGLPEDGGNSEID